MINKNKGITLLALIITVIVMMILAGVTLSMLFGEEGVVTKGRNAAMQTEKKSIHENVLGLITYFEEGIKDLDTTYENIDKHYGTDLIDATRGKTLLTVKIKGKHGEYEYQIDGLSALNEGEAYVILVDDGSGSSTYTMYFIKNEETLEDTKTYYYDEKWNEIIEDTEENKEKIEKSKAKKVEKLYLGIEVKSGWKEKKLLVTSIICKDYIKAPQSLFEYFSNFEICEKINLEKFDTSEVVNMQRLFSGCYKLKKIDLSTFNTLKVKKMEAFFYMCNELEEIVFGNNWNTSNVEDMSHMFAECLKLESIDLSNFNTEKVTKMNNMFWRSSNLKSIDLSNFNTERVENISQIFSGCSSLVSVDLSNFNTKVVKDMNGMFNNCEKLESIKFGENWNTSNVEDMSGMFAWCISLTNIDLINFNTINVKDMSTMFNNCKKIEKIEFGENWNTSNVEDMSSMFAWCISLTILDLSKFNTINVKDMNAMFNKCEKIEKIEFGENWNTSKVTSMRYMFMHCKKILNIECKLWETLNVEDMEYMFTNCQNLTQEIDCSSWNVDKVVAYNNFNLNAPNVIQPNWVN